MIALRAIGTSLDLVAVEIPSPGPRQVLVKTIAVGVCGTDLDIMEGKIDPAFDQ